MADSTNQYSEMAYYYDKLMYDVDYESWSFYIKDIISKNNVKYKDVLEMACGTGNIAIRLAKMGYDITAFDLSEDMLSVASMKALKEGLKIKFLLQDMRNIKINSQFGVILCLCDSINYLNKIDDLNVLFKWVFNHLRDDGIFIFDINSPYKLKSIIGNNTFTYNENDIVYIWDNYLTDDKSVEFYLTFFVKEGELYRRFDEFHIERIYEIEEIKKSLIEVGFIDIDIKNAFTFENPTTVSERLNFIVKKGNS